MIRNLAFFALALLAGGSFFGCDSSCSYPDQQFLRLRLLNAMPDQPKITVFINGKRFQHDFTYDPPANFGYTQTFEDGSPLPAGKIFVVVTRDAAGTDTLLTNTLTPNVHRQTLIVMGRGKKLLVSEAETARLLLLDDEDMTPGAEFVMMRIVHAVPDLPDMDVFFDTVASIPDATIRYGESSVRLVRNSFNGLIVTRAGNPADIITSIKTPFNLRGFFVTTVIRGASKPCDTEPVPAPIILNDIGGTFIIDFPVFGVRFANASKSTTLSLAATNFKVRPEIIDTPRFNIPGQSKVLDIPPDSISEYFGVGLSSLGNTRWFFSRDKAWDTVFAKNLKANANERWTFVAFQNPDNSFNGIALLDSMLCVPEAFGKMRVVNLSPDIGPVTVQIPGANNLSMSQGDVRFVTLPAGVKQVTISSGSGTQSQTIMLPPARPISIYILPSKPGEAYPISISND